MLVETRVMSSQHSMLIALLCALLVHSLLLILVPNLFSGSSRNLVETRGTLSFKLLPKAPDTKIIEKPPVQETIETPQPQSVPQPNKFEQKEVVTQTNKTSAITQHSIQQWLKTETQQHKKTHPQDIEQFRGSFVAPAPKASETIRSYTNAYGEVHVVTKIRGKDVCYMQDTKAEQDEWSADVVMFYDCTTPDKFELNRR